MLSLFARMAWKNVLLYRSKSRLAIMAVATCYFSLNVFQGYIQGAEKIFDDSYSKRNMLGDLLVKKKGIIQAFAVAEEDLVAKAQQAALEEQLRADPDTDLWMRALRVTGTYENGTSRAVFTGIGYDVVAGEEIRHPLWNWNAIAGRPLRAENSEVLLAQGLGKLLGCRAGSSGRFITGQGGYDAQERAFDCKSKKLQLQSATLRGQANSLDVEVVGLVDAMFREVDLRFSYLPLSLAQRLLDTNGVSYYSVRLRAGSDVAAYVNRLNAALLAKGLPLEASPWQADIIGEFYKKTMNFLHVFRNFMVIVILGVALFSIFNTFLRNVQDRTREIGVLRTLGFRVQEIRILFLLETLYLTGLGILMGSGAALLGAAILNRLTILYKIGLLTQPIPLLVLFSPWVLLVTILVVGVVTLGAVTIPLYQSERRKITDSLSYS